MHFKKLTQCSDGLLTAFSMITFFSISVHYLTPYDVDIIAGIGDSATVILLVILVP